MIRLRPIDIFAFCFALLLSLGSWFLLAPKLSQLMSLRAQTQATKDETGLPAQQSQSASQLAQFQTDSAQSALLLPETDGQYDLITQVESTVRGSGLPINGLGIVNVDAPTDLPSGASTGMKELDLSISTVGTYLQIEQLISQLTGLNRFLSVTAVTLGQGGQGGTSQLSAQISASAYYLPNQP